MKEYRAVENIADLLIKLSSKITADFDFHTLSTEQSQNLIETIHKLDSLLVEHSLNKNKPHSELLPTTQDKKNWVSEKQLPDFMRIQHDVMSPLKSIQGAIELGNTMKASKDVKHLFNIIEKCKTSVEEQLNDLLNLMQGTLRHQFMDRINFNDLTKGVLHELSYLPGFNAIKFNVTINNATDFISDNNLVSSIIRNLVSNSIKYKSNDTTPIVNIIIKDSGNGFIIEVSDNGIGISKGALELIFKPYFRTAGERVEGIGMGLYIVNEAVKTLGGTIQVNSSEGNGSNFIVSLPSTVHK